MGNLFDLTFATFAGDSLYRNWDERGRIDHAAALYEQIHFPDHRGNYFFCPVRYLTCPLILAWINHLGRAFFSFATAILGTWIFVIFIQRIHLKMS